MDRGCAAVGEVPYMSNTCKLHEQFIIGQIRMRCPDMDIVTLGDMYKLSGRCIPSDVMQLSNTRVVAIINGKNTYMLFPLTIGKNGSHHGGLSDIPRDLNVSDVEWFWRNDNWRKFGRCDDPSEPGFRRLMNSISSDISKVTNRKIVSPVREKRDEAIDRQVSKLFRHKRSYRSYNRY